jgi:hypothetical protein
VEIDSRLVGMEGGYHGHHGLRRYEPARPPCKAMRPPGERDVPRRVIVGGATYVVGLAFPT